MDSTEELSVLVGRYARSLADYAPEYGFLLESARERDRIGSKLEARARPLCVCARSSGARTEIAGTKCAELVSRSMSDWRSNSFLLTRPTGGMFAVVFCCVFFMFSKSFFFLFESRTSSGLSSSVLESPGAANEVAQQQGCSSCSSCSFCRSSFHHAPEISGSGFCWIWLFLYTRNSEPFRRKRWIRLLSNKKSIRRRKGRKEGRKEWF